jgi:hypothetical protein
MLLFSLFLSGPSQIGDGLTHMALSRDSGVIATCTEDGVIVVCDQNSKIIAKHAIEKRADLFVGAMCINPKREDQILVAVHGVPGFGLPRLRPAIILSRYDDRRDAHVRTMRHAGTTI